MEKNFDEQMMRRCFQLAKCGMGNVAPNPMVGAVVVCDGKIIGEGYHRIYGGAHAEVNAVNSVEDKSLLKRSTIYVSLEPCAHYGKTPPCAKLIIDSEIPRVVVSCRDPFPAVDGKGIEMLREKGVEVRTGVLEEEGLELNKRFFTFHTKHRPYIFLKFAQSADGYMSCEGEKRAMISNEQTLRLVHKMRAEEMAILVGTNTAIEDNPSLTVRHYAGRNPIRVLIDRRCRVPRTARLFDGAAETIVVTERVPSERAENAEYVECEFDERGVRIEGLMDILYERNVQSLIVEGGAKMLGTFIESGIWDEMRVESAPEVVFESGTRAVRPCGRLIGEEVCAGHYIRTYKNI